MKAYLTDGTMPVYYESGKKEEEVTFKNAKRHGLWTKWYESGQLKSEKRYKDDLIIYHNLLNYFPENADDEVIDTLSSQNKEDMGNQKILNINTNILPNVDIKKNFND